MNIISVATISSEIVKYCNEITQYDCDAYDKFKQFSIIEQDNTETKTNESSETKESKNSL